MQRAGVTGGQRWGVPVPEIRQVAKRLGMDHGLARQLWETGVHEARILATLIGNPAARWVASDAQRELLSPSVLMKLK